MQQLSQAFVDQCPVEGGFRMRGGAMTRIEVFVDAAFAFAVTLLVISFDEIPTSFAQMVEAIKQIPAFLVAVAQIVWIWYEHSRWSKHYGLEDAWTVLLSAALLCVVLVYIFPLRVMTAGMFGWFTGGYLPANFSLGSLQELSQMFIFLGTGFAVLCVIFALFYRLAIGRAKALRLSAFELYETRTREWMWWGMAAVGVLCAVLAVLLPENVVQFAGFAFMLLGGWAPLIHSRRYKQRPEKVVPHEEM